MENIENTLITLREFVSEIEENDFLRNHDDLFGGLRKQVEKKSMKLKPPLNVVSKRLYYIADNTFYCIELFNYKFSLLAQGIIHAIETENPLSLANNTRSLLEQLAVFIYLVNHVSTMLEDLKDQGSIEKIDKIISKSEKVINRVYSGEGKNKAKSKDDEAIHVNDAIKELSKKVLDASETYDYLCEFVHPNYGSNVLVSSGELGKGQIEKKGLNSRNIQSIIMCSSSIFEFLSTRKIFHPVITWNVNHLVELCFQKGAKITNVFAEKKPVASGDGKTKETALHFKKARTSQEAMKLQYKYLEEIGCSINPSKRQNGGIKDGYVFDLWNTHLGEIWFKTPMYQGL
ncbi:hypothetical protein [Aliivibrio fischeri]|uniref:hypothetical protein n=1 Tax=Aliivibrio fischeri TaxID=668 RepID=UPI0012D8D32D|nr:hypothetical protein [Aliivibrio fischeri]MUK28395.1 hypothetical protein [Aliivibrio fischeri]MUK33281.1 hypothetical protein [Aliivibrio fischeri]